MAKRKSRSKKTADLGGAFVRVSTVREFFRTHDMRVSGDFIDALNEAIAIELADAMDRAAYNGRVTVSAGDL